MEMERLEGKSRREVFEDEFRKDIKKLSIDFEENRQKLSDKELEEITSAILMISLRVNRKELIS